MNAFVQAVHNRRNMIAPRIVLMPAKKTGAVPNPRPLFS